MFLRYLTVMGLLATVGKVIGNTTETTTLTTSTTLLIESTTTTTTTPVSLPPAPATVIGNTTETTTLTTSTTPLIDSTRTVSTTTTVPSMTTPAPATGTTTLTTSTTPLIDSTRTVSTTTTVPSMTTPAPATGTTTLTSSTTPVTNITTSASTTTVSTTASTTETTTLTPSTKPPTGSTTNASTTTTSTTTTPPVSITTVPVTGTTTLTSSTTPVTNITTSASTTTVSTTASTTGCPAIPCPPQSQCLDEVCLCISGTFLQNGQCIAAQVFPGKLRVLTTFVPAMANRSSEIFQETARNISDALFKALNDTRGYVRSEVVKLEEGSVIATVNNIYQNTNITEVDIQEEIKKAAESDEFLRGATFNITDLCEVEPFPCEETSTTCKSTNGMATCFCKEGYINIPYSNNTCIACPSRQRAVNNECKPCPFGYSGFNCDDSSLLAVVVVSCVLGGILLIVLILFAYCFWKGPLKNSSSKSDYGINSYSSSFGNQSLPAGYRNIPRATTKRSDDSVTEVSEDSHTYEQPR